MTEGHHYDAIIEYLESDKRLRQCRDDESHGRGVQKVLPQQDGCLRALRAQLISPTKSED